mmetsp:Transcript_88399/g.139682  ORF Transcript_88399/g.139682 Transcript_88399/m.139682 type:complete len:213 (-) Transcript_88399:844-1482(-)
MVFTIAECLVCGVWLKASHFKVLIDGDVQFIRQSGHSLVSLECAEFVVVEWDVFSVLVSFDFADTYAHVLRQRCQSGLRTIDAEDASARNSPLVNVAPDHVVAIEVFLHEARRISTIGRITNVNTHQTLRWLYFMLFRSNDAYILNPHVFPHVDLDPWRCKLSSPSRLCTNKMRVCLFVVRQETIRTKSCHSIDSLVGSCLKRNRGGSCRLM